MPTRAYLGAGRQQECGIFALPALVGAVASMEYGAHGLLVMVKLQYSFSRDEIRCSDLGLTRIRKKWMQYYAYYEAVVRRAIRDCNKPRAKVMLHVARVLSGTQMGHYLSLFLPVWVVT